MIGPHAYRRARAGAAWGKNVYTVLSTTNVTVAGLVTDWETPTPWTVQIHFTCPSRTRSDEGLRLVG